MHYNFNRPHATLTKRYGKPTTPRHGRMRRKVSVVRASTRRAAWLMSRDEILDSIRRIAAQNGGDAPGKQRFQRETGIRESDWSGRFWARWSDAVP